MAHQPKVAALAAAAAVASMRALALKSASVCALGIRGESPHHTNVRQAAVEASVSYNTSVGR